MSLLSNSLFSAPVVQCGGESTLAVNTDVDMESSARAAQPAAHSSSSIASTAPLAIDEDSAELVDLGSDDDFGDRIEVLDPSVASLLAHRKKTLLQLCSSPNSSSSLISSAPPCVLLHLYSMLNSFLAYCFILVSTVLYSSLNECRALVLWSSPSAFSPSPEADSSSSLESESEGRQHARLTARRTQHHSRRARAHLSCDASGSEHVDVEHVDDEPPEAQEATSSRAATGLDKCSRGHNDSAYASPLPNLNPRLRPATIGSSYERMEQ